jgi:hypothetical protein
MNVKYGIRNMECRRCVAESVRWHWWRYQPLWASTLLCKERSNCCCRLLRLIIVVDLCCRLLLPTCFAVDHYYRLLLSTFAVDFCCRLLCCKVLLSTARMAWRDAAKRMTTTHETGSSAVWFYAEWYLGPKQCVIYVCFAELTRDNPAWRERGRCCLNAESLSGIVARSTAAIKTSTQWCDKRHQMTDG